MHRFFLSAELIQLPSILIVLLGDPLSDSLVVEVDNAMTLTDSLKSFDDSELLLFPYPNISSVIIIPTTNITESPKRHDIPRTIVRIMKILTKLNKIMQLFDNFILMLSCNLALFILKC